MKPYVLIVEAPVIGSRPQRLSYASAAERDRAAQEYRRIGYSVRAAGEEKGK